MNINIITANVADSSGSKSRSNIDDKNVSGKYGQSFSKSLEKATSKASNNVQAETAREKTSDKQVMETETVAQTTVSSTLAAEESALMADNTEVSAEALAVTEFNTVDGEESSTDETNPAVAPWLFGMPNATVADGRHMKGLDVAKNAIAEHNPTLPQSIPTIDDMSSEANNKLLDTMTTGQLDTDVEPDGDFATEEFSTASALKDTNRSTPVLPQQASETAQNKITELEENLPKAANRSTGETQQLGINSQPLNGLNTQRVGGSEQMTALQLSTPINHANWSQEFGQRLSVLAMRGENQVSLHLNPRELGPLVVDLKMIDNQAQMHIFSNHNQVRAAVEQAIPQLRESLEEQGISLGEATVSHQQSQEQRDRTGSDTHQTGPTFASEGIAGAQDTVLQPNMVIDDGRVSLYI